MGYKEKLIDLAKETFAKKPGPGVHHVAINHDDECPFLNGGECDCNAEVVLMSEDEVNKKILGK